MTEIDNKTTGIHNNIDDATQIADNNTSITCENKIPENDASTTADEENKNKQKIDKTLGGIATGGAVLGGASSVFMKMTDDSSVKITEESAEEENVVIAAEMTELPEVIVEAPGPKNEGKMNTPTSANVREEMGINSSETLYAEMSDPKPYKWEQTSNTQVEQMETISAQSAGKLEEDSFGDDIPIVSVGNAAENEIQILGVTQDISTGYNVGHLSVDGEEVVVIDMDGDMVFDSMVTDLNHDGNITPDEIIDIRQQDLSINNFQGQSDIFNSLISNGDTPDYLSEIVE